MCPHLPCFLCLRLMDRQPEDSMFMVFLFLRFDKLVNKEYISHFRIDTSYDWLKQ